MNKYYQDKIQGQCVKQNDTGCWKWTGQISNSGYGRLMIKDDEGQVRTISATEASYIAFIDDLPEGSMAKPTCGNLLCVNPQHLELFTPLNGKEMFLVKR